MIEESGKRIGENFKDGDDDNGHHNPLADFFPDVTLDNLAEAETENEHDNGGNNSRPKHETLVKSLNVHNII